jgi:hypothetical protein
MGKALVKQQEYGIPGMKWGQRKAKGAKSTDTLAASRASLMKKYQRGMRIPIQYPAAFGPYPQKRYGR